MFNNNFMTTNTSQHGSFSMPAISLPGHSYMFFPIIFIQLVQFHGHSSILNLTNNKNTSNTIILINKNDDDDDDDKSL